MFASIVFWRTGNLWLAVGAHAGWDWGESYFYGVNDSGFQAPGHLLNPHIQGADWLSGGTVGPEGSILSLLILTVMCVLVWLTYRRRSGPERPVLYTMPLPRNE
jgi:membrane protease YdiL (CAAX protease family)